MMEVRQTQGSMLTKHEQAITKCRCGGRQRTHDRECEPRRSWNARSPQAA